MFGLDPVELGVLVAFVAIVALFAFNMSKTGDTEEPQDTPKD